MVAAGSKLALKGVEYYKGMRVEEVLADALKSVIEVQELEPSTKGPITGTFYNVKFTENVCDFLKNQFGLQIDRDLSMISEVDLEIDLKSLLVGDYVQWKNSASDDLAMPEMIKGNFVCTLLDRMYVCAPGVRLKMQGVRIVVNTIGNGKEFMHRVSSLVTEKGAHLSSAINSGDLLVGDGLRNELSNILSNWLLMHSYVDIVRLRTRTEVGAEHGFKFDGSCVLCAACCAMCCVLCCW